MVFDFDPDEGLGFAQVKKAAVELRDLLDDLGLPSWAMVTGGKGVHVVCPLKRTVGWETVTLFSKTLAHHLEHRHPDRFTATMSKARRKGKIFVDYLRNDRGATAIAPYSLRARTGAAVAVPVTWDELEGLSSADAFHADDMEARLADPCPLEGAALGSIGTSAVEALEDWA